ncbi:S1C family serine protease [bacterium]|nr:S1C family serine protease [bacterium]
MMTRIAWIATLAILLTTASTHAADDDQMYWRLRGGGEVVGQLVKETPEEVFIDIGPTIIRLSPDNILSSESLSEAASGETTPTLGLGSGVFDPETGSVIFRAREGASQDVMSRTQIVDEAKRSVVLISNPHGSGSGFIYNDEGLIVTNHHVINGEKYHTVNVFEKDGDQWRRETFEDVEVEAFSPLYDIALLRLSPEKAAEKGVTLRPLPIAPPRSLEVGDDVYAIGNPGMGRRLLEHTVSQGIVSSLARNVNDILYLQTTAAVNPGNSGGPLVNVRGEVVGLVTLKASFQEGIAFALPVELINVFLQNKESFAYSEQAENEGYRYLQPE